MANAQKVMTLADTAQLIAKVHANAAKGVRFEYDGTKGEYGNIAAYFAAHKDGKVYGVRFPKYTYSNTPTGVKTRDNANLTIEISTNDKAGHHRRRRRAPRHRHRRHRHPLQTRRHQRRRVRHDMPRLLQARSHEHPQ